MIKITANLFLVLTLAAGPLAGSTGKLGDGSVEAWARFDSRGIATAFGVTLDDSSLSNLPAGDSETVLVLPVKEQLPFRSVVIDWHAHRHPPAHVYDVPHFDFHFYSIDEDARMHIAPVGEAARATPVPAYVPAGFVTDGSTVPMMGKHYVYRGQPEFNGGVFSASPIYGYYGGHLTFIEAMITSAYLKSGSDLSSPLAQPLRYERHGLYPSRWAVTHDLAHHKISISFTDLEQH